ncbi:hypothetical protein ACIP9H_40530 [Streptomyces sp. NPDC088732]|uniref:hypothetical protein n=1 Tax=Streptomyces sp. NPDC088732 TaxID=3365879 RepID=UPI0037F3C0E8
MTFVLEGRDRLSRVLDGAGKSASTLEKRLLAVSAAAPAAAALAPLIAQTGAAAVAVAAFGAAVVPQVLALGEASEAQKKYEKAVADSGARSKAAVDAQEDYLRTVADMPSDTRRAAAALGELKDSYKGWSDALSGDTMPVFTHSLAVAESVLPKLTPMVKGASAELDRFMTLAAGGVESDSFDRFADRFADFSSGSLKRANDGLVHFTRLLATGSADSSISRFMDYAKAQGPVLVDTLRQIASAAVNLLTAAAQSGTGLLALAGALAGVVAALPPDFIALLMQAALALRAVRMAISGVQLAAGAFALVRTQIVAASTAAIGASGSMATLRAAFMAMSLSARTAVAATGIGLLVLALVKLSGIGRQSPPDIDRMTTALGRLAQTGKVSGEAARVLGSNLSGLYDAVRSSTDPSGVDKFQQSLVKIFSLGMADSTPVKEAAANLDSVDKALANLVRGGHPEQAAAALEMLKTAYGKGGHDVAGMTEKLDNYQSALDDARFEQELTARGMGLFGEQAIRVQGQLDAQKRSADGLRQAIQALNDVNRSAYDAQTKFEAAIDATTKSIADNGATLNVHTEKGRANRDALSQLAAATDDLAAKKREEGASWTEVGKVYDRGREKLIAAAMQMGATKAEAKRLADQILQVPKEKTLTIRGKLDDLQAKLAQAKAELNRVPDSRKAKVQARIDQLEDAIRRARGEVASLDGKTATVRINTYKRTYDYGAVAAGTARSGLATGGPVRGPGTGTSDDVPIMASNGEFMMRTAAVDKYGLAFMEAVNSGRLQKFASGGRILRSLSKSSVSSIRTDTGHAAVVKLTGSASQISAMAAELIGDIERAFKGKKSKIDDHLVTMIEKGNARLKKLASDRDKIAARIKEAKAFAASVTSNAKSGAALSTLDAEGLRAGGGSILSGLQSKLANIKQFQSYISILAKRGLNRGLLQQILEMGPEQGLPYASTLVSASASMLKSINSAQGNINKASTALGNSGADILYDSGKQAGKGLLAGLAAQQKSIEKLMLSIATGMQKSIRRALGIKSPSTIFRQLGRYTTEGLALGLTDRTSMVAGAVARVTDVVAGASMAVPVGATMAAGAGGGGGNIYITVTGALDPTAVARQIEQIQLKYGRHQGRRAG